ncbi:MAG: polyketide synthase, partial [Methylococcales bacterium]|nr:polyketide synthase [Methylococcales bacterium]
MSQEAQFEEREEIAIIGMACRLPGAANIDEYWQNLRDGIESIRAFTPEELAASGVSKETLEDSAFVNAGSVMDDPECFDAAFFGMGIREAEVTDPQHRIMLECAWQALEHAGYNPETYDKLIGVYGGIAPNTYFQKNIQMHTEMIDALGNYPMLIASEREYAITRIAFKLDLRGPSLSVNTACSTSGVAMHLACQSLLNGECDIALTGGGRIRVPLHAGYLYQEDGILSPDGKCRAFDVQAQGTVIGNGMAMLVLKRLSEAIDDKDTIHAVIKATAINNDGTDKVGFTAPSVKGQSAAIREAIELAEIDIETIRYIE